MAYPYELAFQATLVPDAASLRNRDGTAYGSQPSFTIISHGANFYTLYTDGVPDSHQGAVRVTSSGTVVALGLVSPREVESGDVKVSTRNATAPDNAGVAAIKAKTDSLPSDPADASDIAALFVALPAAVLDKALSGHTTAGTVGEALSHSGTISFGSSGAIQHTHTVYKPGGTVPLAGCAVYVTVNADGTGLRSDTRVTDSLGHVVFSLDAGTYYFWHSAPGYLFSGDPDTDVVV